MPARLGYPDITLSRCISVRVWRDDERKQNEAKSEQAKYGHGVAARFNASKSDMILYEFCIDDTSQQRRFELGCKVDTDREVRISIVHARLPKNLSMTSRANISTGSMP